MATSGLLLRILNRSRRFRSRHFACRQAQLRNKGAVVSFTFDDFPRNAAEAGAALLAEHQFAATYYVACGLLDTTAPTGRICAAGQVANLHRLGHEIGCHTFHHLDAWETPAGRFESSLADNARAIQAIIPGHQFSSLSYPINCPHPEIKRRAGARFTACRAGGQRTNHSRVDLNALASFFLEKVRGDLAPVRALVEHNRREGGWLIFSTHDIAPLPTRYGCTPEFFRAVLRLVAESGAEVLPVAEVTRRYVAALR